MDQANGDSRQPVAQGRSLFSNPAFSIWQCIPQLRQYRVCDPSSGLSNSREVKSWSEGVVRETMFYFSVSKSPRE